MHWAPGPDHRLDVLQLESHSDGNNHSEHGTPLDELVPLGRVSLGYAKTNSQQDGFVVGRHYGIDAPLCNIGGEGVAHSI